MSNRKKRYQYIFIGIITALFIIAQIGFFYAVGARLTVSNIFIQFSLIVLLLFLLLLIVRYFFLIWFSYLDHLEDSFEGGEVGEEFTPYCTIIVPAYNEEKVIDASVVSLLQLDYPNFEILIVDDGSTDGTYQRALRFEGRHGNVDVRVLTQENSGKAKALNRGIRHARSDFIVCMDGDSKLSTLTLRKGMRHFRDLNVGAVAGNVKVLNRDRILTKLQALEYIEGLNMSRKAQGFFRVVNIIPGPIGIFRKRVLEDVNYYDSDTFAEDCDLTLKIVTSGWKIKYEPQAVSYTEAPQGLVDLIKQRYRWTRGILQSIYKHRENLFSPKKSIINFAILWYMIFEAIIWPIMNVFAHVLFVVMGLVYGFSYFLFFWWLQLTILDIVAAIHCVAIEGEQLALVPYSFFYRLFFLLIIDVCKLMATVEEYLGVRMVWGKLERTGKL